MYNLKDRFSLLSIRSKIITAFLFGCIVVAFAWMIARLVFRETFATMDEISRPNPKLLVINTLFQKIHQLEYSQKVQLLQVQDKSFSKILDESGPIIGLLDTLKLFCTQDTFQLNKVERMKKVLYQRDELLLNYMKYRYGILKNNPLSKDIQNLSEYVARNIKKGDSNVVKTTRKNTTTTTILNPEDPVKSAEKKEPLLRRIFRKKHKEEIVLPAPRQVTEDVVETIDTFAVTQRDSFMKDMERAIGSIERDRHTRRSKLMNHELKLASASNMFIDELEQLLRQVQAEEIAELQRNTSSLSGVFDNAFTWVEIILCTFLVLILTLIFLIFSDISKSNEVRLQLIEAKEKAEHLEQVKHRFLANMSHEIRTPLQAIIGFSELVKDQGAPQKQALDAIHRSSEHLLQIVNEILDYSRISSGKFVFERRDFSMTELLAEVADILESQVEKKDLHFKLRTDIPADALYAGDAFRLRQILFNLLGNAIKFTQRGEVGLQVTARDISTKKTQFVFEISDTGRGMTEEEQKRIFSSFEQGAETIQREYGGTGLGLSIARRLIEMQGGTIQVKSEKDKGSVFTVTLVYLKAGMAAPAEDISVVPSLQHFQGKVMVVDDDPFILELCKALLSRNQIEHSWYSDPREALFAPWDPAVTMVLIDMRMPGMDGPELFRHLKRKAGAQVKFVALTAQAMPGQSNTFLEEGFDRVLLKPFKEKDFLQLFTDGPSLQDNGPAMDMLDLSSIEKMCMGDEDLLQRSLELLIRETSSDLAHFKDAVSSGNNKQIAGTTHKLSSRAGQCGLYNLAQRLRTIEAAARQNEKYAAAEMEELAGDIEEMIAQVESWRDGHFGNGGI